MTDVSEVLADRKSLINDMSKSLNILASVVIPEMFTMLFPPILLGFWQELVNSVSDSAKKFVYLGIGIPRGHAKTTVIKLFVIYCILFTKRRFILVVCATDSLAVNIISDIADMLDGMNILRLFGDWRSDLGTDVKNEKVFIFRGRPILLLGVGTHTSIRGITRKDSRPDIMIFDDAQTREGAKSEAEARRFQGWMMNTAMKARSPTGCTHIYIGNMYKEQGLEHDDKGNITVRTCMLHNLSEMPEWRTFITGAIQADGSVLWPELHPIEDLMDSLAMDKRLGLEADWWAEIQNDPSFSERLSFDSSKVATYYPNRLDIPHSAFMVVDPSLGKKSSDDLVTGHFVMFEDQVVWDDVRITVDSIPNFTFKTIEWALETGTPVIFIEDYAMQGVIIQWFDFWLEQHSIEGLQIHGINRRGLAKNTAITQFLRLCMNNQIHLVSHVRARVIAQGASFDPRIKSNKDDILDTGFYADLISRNPELRDLISLPYAVPYENITSGNLGNIAGDYSTNGKLIIPE